MPLLIQEEHLSVSKWREKCALSTGNVPLGN